MASFALASTEKDYKVDMSEGQVTLGRGPHLQITDKRVSRNHAIIEVSGSSMTILPIHSNPTFYQACGETKFIPLEKDQSKELQNGDHISFLPDDLIFRVERNKKDSNTEDTSMKASNVEDFKVESSEESFDLEKSEMSEKDDDMNTVEETVSPLKKRRVLPGWMTKNKGKESKENIKKGQTTSKNMKKIEEITEDSVKSPAKDKVRRSLEENEQKTSDKKDVDNDDEKVKEDDAPLETEEQKLHVPEVNEEEDKKRKRDKSEEDEQPSKKEKKLPQCPYGVSCYRKNPVHFQEYSHSETMDESGSEEEPRDDLPECPYGEMCYRKNPRHRKAYKHTPQPKTRERRAKKKAGPLSTLKDNGFNSEN